jgi:hypothetical protein
MQDEAGKVLAQMLRRAMMISGFVRVWRMMNQET